MNVALCTSSRRSAGTELAARAGPAGAGLQAVRVVARSDAVGQARRRARTAAGTVCGVHAGHATDAEREPAREMFSPRSPFSPNPTLIRSPAWTRFSFDVSVFVIGLKYPFHVYVTV